jgi:hypothetical protein
MKEQYDQGFQDGVKHADAVWQEEGERLQAENDRLRAALSTAESALLRHVWNPDRPGRSGHGDEKAYRALIEVRQALEGKTA